MTGFATIGDVNVLALENNSRTQDVVNKKQDILDGLAQYYNLAPTSILFVGFSSFALARFPQEIAITAVSEQVQQYLKSQGVKLSLIHI